MSVDVVPAEARDLQGLVALIGAAEGCAPTTVWSLPWDLNHYWVIRRDGRVVASGSLQPVGDGRRAEIRGIATDPAYRGHGFAKAIVAHLCAVGARTGLEVVCMTRKPGFFERQGFTQMPAHWLSPLRVDAEGGQSDDAPRIALRCSPISRGEQPGAR